MTEPETVVVGDGRRLAYEEYGRTDGRPVVCLHGNPGSRLLWSLFDETAQHHDARLIAPDRPGFGASDFRPDRDLLDWVDDVRTLAKMLDLDTFSVVGFSAGGPHAAACAHELDRVERAVLVSSPGPPETRQYATASNRRLTAATRSVPGLSRGLFGLTGWLARHWLGRFRETIESGASDADRELFAAPDGTVVVADAAEAFAQGGRGPAHEFPMLGEPWGFDPADCARKLSLWHGRQDERVPLRVAQAVASRLPDTDVTVVDAGHYSTLVEQFESILLDARR
ncbi:alpha/beta fold hydrolase [Halomicrobium mukohataei]|uniref:Alpha/beta fold hydrolase n=1 Tax=Halomicrobium mukohataei TaxID=57705 RepID=A0A847TT55_9EURY|nr:alpha/beta hydrolase [Halomicrobium mukohataei]NLV09222.1 alpha/beta fold hydrolase [Halomicrobium mukohataei]